MRFCVHVCVVLYLANGGFIRQKAQSEEGQVRRCQNGQGHWGGRLSESPPGERFLCPGPRVVSVTAPV